MDGPERIAVERRRQVGQEGWEIEHDASHDLGALSKAAVSYIEAAQAAMRGRPMQPWRPGVSIPDAWPWSEDWWKPAEEPIRNLEKAGALIAAEIDRLLYERMTDG